MSPRAFCVYVCVYRKLRNNSYVMQTTSSLVFAVSRIASSIYLARGKVKTAREEAARVWRLARILPLA